jgi:hypothetical protein
MTDRLKTCLLLAMLLTFGCSKIPADATGSAATAAEHSDPDHAGHDHTGHDHAAEGPHHGMLLELGDGELHAELVHGRDWATIYVLDAAGKTAVPIDQPEIFVNVTSQNGGTQFSLKASPDKGDPVNRCSRFVTEDRQLAEAISSAAVVCRIALKNGDVPYGAVIPRENDHAH